MGERKLPWGVLRPYSRTDFDSNSLLEPSPTTPVDLKFLVCERGQWRKGCPGSSSRCEVPAVLNVIILSVGFLCKVRPRSN